MATSSPIVSEVSERYASALFELAVEAGSLDAVDAALGRFLSLLDESADFSRLVSNPVFTADEQKAALDALLPKAGIEGLAANFLKLIASKRRLFAVRGMVLAFRAQLAAHKGIAAAEVTVAAPLSDKNRAAVLEALQLKAGKSIALSEKVDPSIIGGLIVKMGSRMIDASLKTRLNGMKRAMISGI